MDHRVLPVPAQDPPDPASAALIAMEHALQCLDAVGAHQCGAHLDYVIHLFRQWCGAQHGLELLRAPRGDGT